MGEVKTLNLSLNPGTMEHDSPDSFKIVMWYVVSLVISDYWLFTIFCRADPTLIPSDVPVILQHIYHKGPFLYYVRVFWGLFEPPTHLRKDIFTT